MKKTILIIGAVLTLVASSYAQGNMLVSGPTRGIWNILSGTPILTGVGGSSNLYYAILFGSSASTPLISSIAGTGLSSTGIGSGEYTPTNVLSSFSVSTAWTDILNDPNFHLLDGTTASTALVGPVLANGSVNYNSSSAYQADNVTGGTAYHMYLIAWSSIYATPGAAQTAGAGLGWSQYFTYTPGAGINTPNGGVAMSTLVNPFGVVNPVPEPSTMALAGLGGAALLLFRRRTIK